MINAAIKNEDKIEYASTNELEEIIEKRNLDRNKLRLNIGGGDYIYSNTINFELTTERNNEVDILGDVKKGLPFENKTFIEVMMIHVIEHIEYNYHSFVFDEIWRTLKPNGRVIISFPDFIECAKAFIENRYGRRWELYHWCIFGRQAGTGDYHVSAIERNDITNKLMNAGFKDIHYIPNRINATVVAKKGDKLKTFL